MNRVFLVEEKDVPAVRLQGAIEEAGSDEPVIHKDDQVINGDDFIFTPSPYGHITGISRLRIRATNDHCL